MLILGLTGSIGMGKSATARMFAERAIPVYDADAAVRQLYDKGAAVAPIAKAFPGAVRDGVVDREFLASNVLGDKAALARLEALVHPLVRAAEQAFLEQARARGARIALLEIPLLLETGGERRCHAVIVANAPADVQRERVLARGVSEERLRAILARQMPDAEKRKRAHFIVETQYGFAEAEKQVDDILRALSSVAAGAIEEAVAS